MAPADSPGPFTGNPNMLPGEKADILDRVSAAIAADARVRDLTAQQRGQITDTIAATSQ
ncbi:hypothetical protein [Rhodococcus opacus]|uniref:hypothetical protein n=1 Tax=Rhodococcus opacus TaxID=37919 RepID=UPI002949A1D8|nr:hypothetical protein [Rhodococcus opacus]MDV6247396.1 hypothetical protein [Rhodococcus opacus]